MLPMLKLVIFLSFMLSFCTAMSGQGGIALNHSAFFQGSLKKGFHFYKKKTPSHCPKHIAIAN
jgi:hypothetical protein